MKECCRFPRNYVAVWYCVLLSAPSPKVDYRCGMAPGPKKFSLTDQHGLSTFGFMVDSLPWWRKQVQGRSGT